MNDHHQHGQCGRSADEVNQQWINRELNMMEAGGSLGGAAGGAGMTRQRTSGDESHKCFGTDLLAPGGGGTGGGTETMPVDWDSRRSADANFFNAFGFSPGGSSGLHGRRSGGTQSEHRHPFQHLQSPPQLQQQQRPSFPDTDESFLTLEEMYAQTQQMRSPSLQHQKHSPSLQHLQAQGQCDDSPRGRARAAYERRREERQRQLQGPQEQTMVAASARPAQVSGKKRNRGGRKSSAYGGSGHGGSAFVGSGLDEESMEQLRARAGRAAQELASLREQRSNQYHDENEHEFELDDGAGCAGYTTESAPLVGRASPLSGRKEQAASANDGSAHGGSSSNQRRDAFCNSEQSAYRTDDEEDESGDRDGDNAALLTPRANGTSTGTDAGHNRRDCPAQMGAVANADTINRTVRALVAEQGVRRRGSEALAQSEEVQPKRHRASASGQGRRPAETTISAINNTGSLRIIDLLIGPKVPGKKYYPHTCKHNNTKYLNVSDYDDGTMDPTSGWKKNPSSASWSNVSRKTKNTRIDDHVLKQYALAGIEPLSAKKSSSPAPVAGSDSNAAAAPAASSGNGLALASVPGAGANTVSGLNNGPLAALLASGWQLVHPPSGPAGAGQHHGISFGPQSASVFGQFGFPATMGTGGGNLSQMLATAGDGGMGGGNLLGMPGLTGITGMAGLGGSAGVMGGMGVGGVGRGGGLLGGGQGALQLVLQQQQQQLLQQLLVAGAAPTVAAGAGAGGGGNNTPAFLVGPTAAGGGGAVDSQLLAQFLAGSGAGNGNNGSNNFM